VNNKNSSLKNEDTFDNIDCSEYEIDDYPSGETYLSLDENEEPDNLEDLEDLDEVNDADMAETEAKSKKKSQRKQKMEEELNFYTQNVVIERGEKSRKRYAKLAEIARNGTLEEQKNAREEACFYMKGLVLDFITKKYRTYVERDPTYREVLEQEAYLNIIKYLPDYDPLKGLPTTFFFYQIKSAMSRSTNLMKHSISSSDAALQRKIKAIRSEYEKLGREPEIADYMIETGETMSKIRSVLRMMKTDMNTHLEAIEEYDQIIPGDATKNSVFDSPENIVMRKMMCEGIMKRMREIFPEDEINIFLRHAINDESIPSIAKSMKVYTADDKIRRVIEKVRHAIEYDTDIRKLCASHINDNMSKVATITILPFEGMNENMDTLETIML